MKKILIFLAVLVPAVSVAASITLTNGGLGQVASNPSQFGVAVCNGGSVAITQSVPVTVSVNGQVANISSAPSIAVGACEYSYIPYSQLDMQVGQTYSAIVTINNNANGQATYSVTVPGAPSAAAAKPSAANTADVNAQSGNIFTSFWNWLTHLW